MTVPGVRRRRRAGACHGVGPQSDERRAIKQALRCVVSGEHQFNALSQLGVLAAGLLEPGGSLRRRDGQSGQKYLFQRA